MTEVVGVDSSTQSTKILRVDAETGKVLAQGSAPHPDGTAVDPSAWREALLAAAGSRGTRDGGTYDGGLLAGAAAVSVAAQQHGMVALDRDGEPVMDALLWNDTRSAPQAARLREAFGAEFWAGEIGVVPVPSFTITKLAWLREERPALADRVERVLLPHDWLTWQLGGRPTEAVTDRSDASGTGYYSVPQGRYRHDILEHAFGRVPELPRVLGPAEAAGETAGGALLGPGCGDNAAAALGLGLRPGDVAVSIGTSGTVFASSSGSLPDPSGAIAGFADATGKGLPLLCTLNAARVLDGTARLLGRSLEELDRLALDAAPDAGGLVLLPYLDGERTPDLPGATGTLRGMRLANLGAENMARAAVLGVLCSLAEALDRLRASGVPVRRAVLTGGAARSRAVREAAAELFGVEVSVPEPAEHVALGAARQAAWVLSGAAEPPAWEAPSGTVHAPSGTEWAAEVRGRYAEERLRVYGV